MKKNQKCVRLSDEVLAIVNSYSGNGFNDKFENFVLDGSRQIPERERKIKALDADIKAKEAKLRSLTDKIRKAEQISIAVSNQQFSITVRQCISISVDGLADGRSSNL